MHIFEIDAEFDSDEKIDCSELMAAELKSIRGLLNDWSIAFPRNDIIADRIDRIDALLAIYRGED